jgi:hypothetical protein
MRHAAGHDSPVMTRSHLKHAAQKIIERLSRATRRRARHRRLIR